MSSVRFTVQQPRSIATVVQMRDCWQMAEKTVVTRAGFHYVER
jgi:hypothetical protein